MILTVKYYTIYNIIHTYFYLNMITHHYIDQQLWLLENEMHILPGDDLYLECVYNSTDRDYISWGGESTRHEMCFSFLYVYPKTDLKMCATRWTYDSWMEFWNEASQNGWVTGDVSDADNYQTWDYDVSTEEALEYYRDFWKHPQRDMFCWGKGTDWEDSQHLIEIPSEFEEYPEPDYCAENSNDGFVWDSWYGYTIIIASILITMALLIVVIIMCRKKKATKNGYRRHLDEESNKFPQPTKRDSGEHGVVSLQPSAKNYGATTD